MKNQTLIAGSVILLLIAGLATQAADQLTLTSRPGSKMRIEGTSSVHDWQVESPFIGGFMEVPANFPLEPGQAASPGKMEVKADVFVAVRSLHSKEKDGKPYSDKMDEVMWEHLKAQQFPKIQYRLSELTLKEPAKAKDAPNIFDSKGELVIAGATNAISMPVNITPLGDKKLKIAGNTSVKMTSFKVQPPSPAFLPIKTGDDVKIIFDWIVAPKPSGTASAGK